MRDCEHCNLDRVSWEDVISCTCLSVQNVYADMISGKSLSQALLQDDRILYLVGLVLLLLTFRLMIFSRHDGHIVF